MINRGKISTLKIDITTGDIIDNDIISDINNPRIISSNVLNPDPIVEKTPFYDSPGINTRVEKINYSTQSSYLKRALRVQLSNFKGNTYTFLGNRMSISGTKYIGIQQDQFTITMQNIDLSKFGKAINNGYIFVSVYVGESLVFFGKIKALNTARESVVEKTIEMVCLTRVTDLLSDMVSPITVNSGANIWAILSEELNIKQVDLSNIDQSDLDLKISLAGLSEEFKTLKFEEGRTFSGYKKTVIDDIIKVANDQISRTANTNLPWIDYTYDQNGLIQLFTSSKSIELYSLTPNRGLLDTPTVSEDTVSFNAIFTENLVPGRVVKLNNALFKTLGNETAFIFGFDPKGEYVITEVRYSFKNFNNEYTVSCNARPFSKYNNFTASLGG